MKNRVEILAPAGSYEVFLAVMNAGADAVYLAGNMFGARWQRSCGSQMKSPSCVTVPGSQQSLHRT